MNQLSIDFDAAPMARSMPQARAEGAMAGDLAADRAERQEAGFSERAADFVLSYLRNHGISSGELVTDAAKLAGIRPPDDRAFGPVYAGLARKGLIFCGGYCMRRKGRGTAGGRLWRLA